MRIIHETQPQIRIRLMAELTLTLSKWAEKHEMPPTKFFSDYIATIDLRLSLGQAPKSILEDFEKSLFNQDQYHTR